jgi:hypothetical protein
MLNLETRNAYLKLISGKTRWPPMSVVSAIIET